MNNTKTLRNLPALLFFSAILALPAQATTQTTTPKPGWYIAYHKANTNSRSSKLEGTAHITDISGRPIVRLYLPLPSNSNEVSKVYTYEDFKKKKCIFKPLISKIEDIFIHNALEIYSRHFNIKVYEKLNNTDHEYHMLLKKAYECAITWDVVGISCSNCYRQIRLDRESNYFYNSCRFADYSRSEEGVILDEVIVCLNCISDHFCRKYTNQLGLFKPLLEPLLKSLLVNFFRSTSGRKIFPNELCEIIYQYILGDKLVRNKRFQEHPFQINTELEICLTHGFDQTNNMCSFVLRQKEEYLKQIKQLETEKRNLDYSLNFSENNDEHLKTQNKNNQLAKEALFEENNQLKRQRSELSEYIDNFRVYNEQLKKANKLLDEKNKGHLKQINQQKTILGITVAIFVTGLVKACFLR